MLPTHSPTPPNASPRRAAIPITAACEVPLAHTAGMESPAHAQPAPLMRPPQPRRSCPCLARPPEPRMAPQPPPPVRDITDRPQAERPRKKSRSPDSPPGTPAPRTVSESYNPTGPASWRISGIRCAADQTNRLYLFFTKGLTGQRIARTDGTRPNPVITICREKSYRDRRADAEIVIGTTSVVSYVASEQPLIAETRCCMISCERRRQSGLRTTHSSRSAVLWKTACGGRNGRPVDRRICSATSFSFLRE